MERTAGERRAEERGEKGRTEQNRTEQNRTEQNRTEQKDKRKDPIPHPHPHAHTDAKINSHRFRNGYCKSNPRKMVGVWAEKELRNLRRLDAAGIRCPQPLLLKNHILIMRFIGSGGWPAPRLKDAPIAESNGKAWKAAYIDVVRMMRVMFRDARLIHGDLSEYNLLYHNSEVYFIDVSQSVEHDHPRALEFLRKDVENVNDFFRKKGVCVILPRPLFDFVTEPSLDLSGARSADVRERVEKLRAKAEARERRRAEREGGRVEGGGEAGATVAAVAGAEVTQTEQQEGQQQQQQQQQQEEDEEQQKESGGKKQQKKKKKTKRSHAPAHVKRQEAKRAKEAAEAANAVVDAAHRAEQKLLHEAYIASLIRDARKERKRRDGLPVSERRELDTRERLFMQAYIPQSLNEVWEGDAVGDLAALREGGDAAEGVYYAKIAGIVDAEAEAAAKRGAVGLVKGEGEQEGEAGGEGDGNGNGNAATGFVPSFPGGVAFPGGATFPGFPPPSNGNSNGGGGGDDVDDDDDDNDDDNDDNDEEEEESEGKGDGEEAGKVAAGPPMLREGATKEERKAHKAAVKAYNRERRATRKIKKHVKKRSTKRKT